MLDDLIKSSKETAEKHKKDPKYIERMQTASRGQSPRLFLISPVNRGSQDLEMLSIQQGDAFHASRIPNKPLLPWAKSPILFAGPSAYYSHFHDKQAIVITFEMDEPADVIDASLRQVVENPDLHGLRIIALKMDYDGGKARLVPHGFGRAYDIENRIVGLAHRPSQMDQDTLVVICSDSRVRSPPTQRGLPWAIQTLGGYLPAYTGESDETGYLNTFLKQWLSGNPDDKRILLVAHGNFEGDGPSCGAGEASLSPETISGERLRSVIEILNNEATRVERRPAASPEDRAKSIAEATRANLLSYPSIAEHTQAGLDTEFIQTVLMDTVTNVVFNVKYGR